MTKTNPASIPGHISTRISLRRLRDKLRARRQARRDRIGYRQMLELDAHLLKDIGLTRGDIVWAVRHDGGAEVASELHAVRRRRAA